MNPALEPAAQYQATRDLAVVIPAFNEARSIDAVLVALLKQQTESFDFDVIVVDTGSEDDTCARVRTHPVILLQVSERSSYVARNAGVRASKASRFAFLDADCIPDPGWLQNLLAVANAEASDYVAGRIENDVLIDNLGNHLLACRTDAEVRRRGALQGNVAGGNMLVHRRVFERIGLFAEVRSGADIRQSQLAQAAGFKIAYATEARVRHQCDLSNWDYLARRVRIRRGQAAHGSRTSLSAVLSSMPWRPGWSEAKRCSRQVGKPIIPMFLFLWLERWADFVGALLGAVDARRVRRVTGSGIQEVNP